jgi:addiction module RelE/StbE family toxin
MLSGADEMYKLDFLPIAKQDMTEIVNYISHELYNPAAAEKLADEMIKTAESLVNFPYVHAVYKTVKPLKNEYRKLPVKNYIIFYWINEKKKQITIARVIYTRRDYKKLL